VTAHVDTPPVPNPRQDRIGLLVVRAFVEEGKRRTLLVRVLEVNPPGPDRVLSVTGSSRTASRVVGRWLDSLRVEVASDDVPHDGAEGAVGDAAVTHE
jgi:hypothetical protein